MFDVPKHNNHMLTRNQHKQMDTFERFMNKIIEEQSKDNDRGLSADHYEG